MSRRHLIMLLALAAIWGASFMLIKIGVRELEPSTLVLARVVLALLTLLPIVLLSERGFAGLREAWVGLLILGSLNSSVPFWLLSFGETRIDSGLSAVIQAGAPIFTALIALRFDRTQQVTGLRLVGLVIGLGGVALLVGNERGGQLVGALAIALTGLCYAASSIYAGRWLSHLDPAATGFGAMVAATVLAAPAGIAQAPSDLPGAKVLLSVAALGIVGTGLAYILYFGLIRGAGASKAILVTYLVPAIALVYGAILLDEAVTLLALVGLGLVLLGVALGTGNLTRRPLAAEATGSLDA